MRGMDQGYITRGRRGDIIGDVRGVRGEWYLSWVYKRGYTRGANNSGMYLGVYDMCVSYGCT